MAKRVRATTYLTDDKGRQQKFGPNDDLPKWAVSQLNESWGADRDDLWGGDDDESSAADGQTTVREDLAAGRAVPDRTGEVDLSKDSATDDRTMQAVEVLQEARNEAAQAEAEAAGVDPDADSGPANRVRRSGR